jgi:hypothetical protein
MAEGTPQQDPTVYPTSALGEPLAVLSDADPQFLHAVLCQLGLPRNPTSSKTFERTSGRASLSLQAGRAFDGLKWLEQPLPSGTRPRLVLINLCSEAVRTRSATVDIGGSVREFLRRLNIDAGGKNMGRFRKQMLALSSCHMTLAMTTAKGTTQVDAKPIDAFQAWHTNEGGQQTLWPGYIRLTDKFFESLLEHAVPLDPEAIGRLQNSAFALDVYSWLTHRLCRVTERQGVDVSWAALREQFGQEYSDPKNFRRKFTGALQKATLAYKEARIEAVPGGLKLLPSPPPIKRTRVTVMKAQAASHTALAAPRPLVRDELVSENALQQVPHIAPGWDKHFLMAKYKAWIRDKGMPDKPDAAFLGWVKKFTREKPPA